METDKWTMKPGVKYVVTTRMGQQRYSREHVMTYLGETHGGHQFNARPFAGTQSLDDGDIVDVRLADPKTPHSMNKVVKRLR